MKALTSSALRRWIFLLHRWLGIGLCVFFVAWFVSGMVMLYVGYPKLSESERLAHLPPLPHEAALLPPSRALALAGVPGPLKDLRLHAGNGRPSYFATPTGGRVAIAVDAISGQRLTAIGPQQAMASAAVYAAMHSRAHLEIAYLGPIDEDAFTHSRALDAHRPLHHVALGDAQGTRLYISGRTAEVVRDATRAERGWNYQGAWLHWLYMFRGNALDDHWSSIVNSLSIAGIALTAAGLLVGWQRWRFARPYASGRRTPYPGRLMRWHHLGGLLFGLLVLGWIFSGLMSMNPWRIFDSNAEPLQIDQWQAGPLMAPDTAPASLLAQTGPAAELRWMRAPGQDLVQIRRAQGQALVFETSSASPWLPSPESLRTAGLRLLDAPLLRSDRLEDYDFYYYARADHSMTGGHDKPLPVLRLVFGDAAQTWVHVDAHTGQVLGRLDRGQRAWRWLFALLHSWDWLPLLSRRPLWDVFMIVMSLGGLMLSATGLVQSARRLARKTRQGRHR
ncbi:PepSY domain-containing protein [Comamonas composti]|uniref:PepSY domain-containing protein n=1 Tax=Comamonas composti TaxID=408558 RepID=UPI00040121BB|nr:PepSY domain-containing protein [Comamonas composti]